MPVLTSAFNRRIINGASILCKFDITLASCCPEAVSNQESKVRISSNKRGAKKLSRAQSYCRLFCNGVPVIMRRCAECNEDRAECVRPSSFFSLCASSTIKYCHSILLNALSSSKIISYVVTTTSYLMWSTGCKWDLISVGRRSLDAWNLYTLSAGHQCFN